MSRELKEIGEDLRLLAHKHGVQTQTVLKLLEGGIPEDEIDELLDIRDSLTSYGGKEIHGQVTVEACLNVYKALDSDIDAFVEVGGIAFTKAGNYTQLNKCISTFDYNKTLYDALEEYRAEIGSDVY